MLKMTMSPQEYIQIGENIRIVFTGGSKNNMHILIDAPREINIVRSKVLEQNIREDKRKRYYRDEDKSSLYRKKDSIRGVEDDR
ncbi:MAG: carbon storage regulator [Lachnospiraceae bacterium]|nr:carbon storage regulator [Lachnospiraceae bacterium]